MSKRIAIVREGLIYKKKLQIRSGSGYTPRYSGAIVEAGGKKTAHRHIPIRKRDEERREIFFRLKIIRDDGTIIDDTLIDEIEIFDDDPDLPGYVGNPPILYIYNMREYYEYLTPEEVELSEDVFYNLDSGGVRKKERYNSNTGYWTFNGYQRPLSWMWGDTETDDLTKPTSPPSSRKKARKWSDDLDEYVTQETAGYYIKVRYTQGPTCIYRVLTEEQKEEGQLARGYSYLDDSLVYQSGDIVYMIEENLVKPRKYIFQVPYVKGEQTTSYPEEDYDFYRWQCYEDDPPECKDTEDINYSKPYFLVDHLGGLRYYSTDTYFWRKQKIISSVPYNLHEKIEHNISLYCISGIPYYAGFSFTGTLDSITTTISGVVVSSVYTSTEDETDKIEGDIGYPRTFAPVNITEEFSVIPEEEMNEQEYIISMNIIGGAHRVGIGREFSSCFAINTTPKDENA